MFTVIPVVSAGALNGIDYLDENGEVQTADDVTAMTNGSTELTTGWYAVTADTEINSRITCTGDVHLILCNNTTLIARKGITVSGDDNSLTIYQQAEEANAETDKLANGGNDYFSGEVTLTSSADNMSEYLDDCGLEYVGTSVVYLSGTTLRHYYRIVDDARFTEEIRNGITFDGEAVTCGKKNDMIYFDKKNISVSQLDTEYALKINGHEYHYAALDYSALAYNDDETPIGESITKQLAAAVYRDNEAANAYFSTDKEGI